MYIPSGVYIPDETYIGMYTIDCLVKPSQIYNRIFIQTNSLALKSTVQAISPDSMMLSRLSPQRVHYCPDCQSGQSDV